MIKPLSTGEGFGGNGFYEKDFGEKKHQKADGNSSADGFRFWRGLLVYV